MVPHKHSACTAHVLAKLQATHCQRDQPGLQSQSQTWLAKTTTAQSAISMLCMSLPNPHDGRFERNVADLVEVSGSQLPGLGGKVDVVAVMHLRQVVEAAGLHTQVTIVSLSLSKEGILCASWHKAFGLTMACMASVTAQ